MVPDNVFQVSSGISSTWGGNLTDMVRARRILEVIERDGLIERAAAMGKYLLAGLREIAARHPALVARPRGRGLMCAVTLPSAALRDPRRAPTATRRHGMWCFGLSWLPYMVSFAAGSAGHPGSRGKEGTRWESGTAPQR